MESGKMRTWVEINLNSLKKNISAIRQRIDKTTRLCAVIKADAYGHGALKVARTVIRSGATYLAVACLEEALELREGGISTPILVLGYTPPSRLSLVVRQDITQTIYDFDTAAMLSRIAQKQERLVKIHVKLDTGMNRIGFQVQPDRLKDSVQQLERLYGLPALVVEGMYTHFAKADECDLEFTQHQLTSFLHAVQILEAAGHSIPIKHTANSAAIIEFPQTHLDMVRPGIVLYGLYPDSVEKDSIALEPVMNLKTVVAHVKEVPAGTPIGYGGVYSTERKSRIATLPVGYADGYSRRMSPGGYVIVNNCKAPIVGSICMDQCMVDVTGIPRVQAGDTVLLFGRQSNCIIQVDQVASISGTIRDEVITRISKRVPRIYIEAK
jgi:alanine racemase